MEDALFAAFTGGHVIQAPPPFSTMKLTPILKLGGEWIDAEAAAKRGLALTERTLKGASLVAWMTASTSALFFSSCFFSPRP
jgi:hypothetical protein